MTRQECEDRLIGLMEQAMEVYRACVPDAGSLSYYADGNGYINVSGHRKGFDPDAEGSDGSMKTYTLYATRFSDGDTWHLEKWAGAGAEQEEQA